MKQPEASIQVREGLFEKDGSIGSTSREFLEAWMNRYFGWVRAHV